MVKRSRNYSRVSSTVVHESSTTRSSRLRSTNNTRTAEQTETRRSDFSSGEERRKRPRNSTEMRNSSNSRTRVETGSVSARERTNRNSVGDCLTNRSEAVVSTSTSTAPRRCSESSRPNQQREFGNDDPIERSVKYFIQAKTASQSMKSLMSENQDLFQEFKSFLISNLPCTANDHPEANSSSDNGDSSMKGSTVSVATNTTPLAGATESPNATVDWTEDLKSTLKCTICQEFCHQCVTVCPCFHTFCGGCLSTWFERLANKKTCPTCREKVFSVSKNVHADALVNLYLDAHVNERRSEEELSGLQNRDTLYCAHNIMISGRRESRRESRLRNRNSVNWYFDDREGHEVRVHVENISSTSETDTHRDNEQDIDTATTMDNDNDEHHSLNETSNTRLTYLNNNLSHALSPMFSSSSSSSESEDELYSPPVERGTNRRASNRAESSDMPDTTQFMQTRGSRRQSGVNSSQRSRRSLPNMTSAVGSSRFTALSARNQNDILSDDSQEIVSSFLDAEDEFVHSDSVEEMALQERTEQAVSSTSTYTRNHHRPHRRSGDESRENRVSEPPPSSNRRETRSSNRRTRVRCMSHRTRASSHRHSRRTRPQIALQLGGRSGERDGDDSEMSFNVFEAYHPTYSSVTEVSSSESSDSSSADNSLVTDF